MAVSQSARGNQQSPSQSVMTPFARAELRLNGWDSLLIGCFFFYLSRAQTMIRRRVNDSNPMDFSNLVSPHRRLSSNSVCGLNKRLEKVCSQEKGKEKQIWHGTNSRLKPGEGEGAVFPLCHRKTEFWLALLGTADKRLSGLLRLFNRRNIHSQALWWGH